MLLWACVAGSAACSDEIEPIRICDLPSPTVTPPSAVVRPGESVTYSASGPILQCDGTRIAAPIYRWRTSDPRVATIDSVTGVATPRDTGQTTLVVRVVQDGNIQGAAAIVVRP